MFFFIERVISDKTFDITNIFHFLSLKLVPYIYFVPQNEFFALVLFGFFLVFLLFLCSLCLDVLLRSVSETLGAESRHRCHPHRHHCHSCCHTQSHCWLNLRSGNPTYEGGAVHQDGHPHHIPAEQELPAVIRHLG